MRDLCIYLMENNHIICKMGKLLFNFIIFIILLFFKKKKKKKNFMEKDKNVCKIDCIQCKQGNV